VGDMGWFKAGLRDTPEECHLKIDSKAIADMIKKFLRTNILTIHPFQLIGKYQCTD